MWKIGRVSVALIFLICLTILLGLNFPELNTNVNKLKTTNPQTIHIASVVCSDPGDNETREELAVMIKSVIISAKMYSVQKVTFHFLLEHIEDENYFLHKLKEFGHPFKEIEMSLFTYSIRTYVPQVHHSMLFQPEYRCMYARYFFPRILNQLDAVLYLDTDFIVLGNLKRYWDIFEDMNQSQMMAGTVDTDGSCPFNSSFYDVIPHVKPKGLASGLLLMNLTKLREFNWEEKFLRLFFDYSKLQTHHLNDQQSLNIMFYYNSGALKLLPCQYQFWWVYCGRTDQFCCPEAYQDPQGIIGIAGASEAFEPHQIFREIYLAYENINLTNPNVDFKRDLMTPIRNAYSTPFNITIKQSNSSRPGVATKCDGIIHKFLFKDYFI